ncbi:YbaK/EbsC family protein [Bacteroidota bacterium]
MFDEIKKWLISRNITFKEVHHEPTQTSEEAAHARGVDLSLGGKALVLKIDDNFRIFVLSASKKLESRALKKYFKAKKMRFADKDELKDLTGLIPGSVPPFGRPLIEMDLFVDQSIVDNETIAFNAGSLTDSIIMSVKDYLEIARPTIIGFSK